MTEKPRLATIGIDLNGNSSSFLSWESKSTLTEFDVVVALLSSAAFGPTVYKNSHFAFDAMLPHWNAEISLFLEAGKTLVVLATDVESIGKDNKTCLALSGLPWKESSYLQTRSLALTGLGQSIFSNHSALVSAFDPKVVFEVEGQKPLLTTKDNSGRTFGALIDVGPGRVFVLPGVGRDNTSVHSLNFESGGITIAKNRLLLQKFALEISERSIRTALPSWTADAEWVSQKEKDLLGCVERVKGEIDNLQEQLAAHETEASYHQARKALLFATGTELENAVRSTLVELGLDAKPFNFDGQNEIDAIFEIEGIRFVCEIEGKDNKAIDFTKYRQLTNNLMSEIGRLDAGRDVRGILFGNGFRSVNPNHRQDVFTQHVVTDARKRQVSLINTVDLYRAWKDVTDGIATVETIHQRLLSSMGGPLSLSAPTTEE